jgi:UDP-N-acetylglucosamine--N-acetylmuramyl-(pentapeptide) pyrophosphoryl-undecaprenol N-acetylglucosamine transferase
LQSEREGSVGSSNEASLRILISAGGTGGHIIPGLAVARELVARHNAEILFAGTPRGLESRLVPGAGFALKLIEIGPLNNVPLSTKIKTVLKLPTSFFAARHLIREFKPDAVLSVGGYSSGPVMAAALQLKIPAMVVEPNAMPGLANRLVGKHVHAAAVNFAAAEKWFRNPEVTGIPVRPEFFKLQPPPVGAAPHLLVFGGSQGARIFNVHVPEIATALLETVPALTILHQSGAKNFDATQAAYAASGADPARWQVRAFLDDMPAFFAQAHLVLSRSGASTVAELAAAAKPALLVPFAAAADDHQRRNAEAMANAGAAAMLLETDLNVPHKLLDTLSGLLAAPERLAAMAQGARAQSHPGAAERIADRLSTLAGRRP